MHFAAVTIPMLAFAATVLSEPWKNIGGDLAYVGPTYNATFKAGDTIPFEYTFYTVKMVRNNSTAPTPGVNGTAPPTAPSTPTTGTASLTSLRWVGQTGNETVEIKFDNGRTEGYSSPCLPTDTCTGTYYPKRIDLLIPAETYPSNYTIVLGYTLSLAGNRTLFYKEPITVVPASANVTSPKALIAGAPATQVTLPVYAPPGNSGLVNQVSKVALGMTIVAVSAILML
ncbi:hypothetical protein BX616_000565 [Lobosporangium transversale]|nr:hypothetical protein BX616_000565 [Lobosporangium transversale]